MTEADRIFERFPDFVREFIFTHRWESLRGVQVAAARTLFLTGHHLLLTSLHLLRLRSVGEISVFS